MKNGIIALLTWRFFCWPCWLFLAAVGIQAGHLAELQTLDLSYNNSISGQGWAKLCQALTALEQLSELDVSLRPSSSCDCGDWLGQLLATLQRLPAFAELGLQGWLLSEVQQKELERFNRDNKHHILFDIPYGCGA